MHKVTYLLLKSCFLITAVFLMATVVLLLSIKPDTGSLGHTLLMVREMCATGSVILLISLVGSAVLHEKLSL